MKQTKNIFKKFIALFVNDYGTYTFDKHNLTINWENVCLVVLLAAMTLKAYLIFWQFNYFHLLVPPSPDLITHVRMTDNILGGGSFISNGYPPLFHYLIAFLSKFYVSTPLEVLRYIAPYWMIIVIPPFHLLCQKMYGYKVAFFATLIFTLVSTNPLLNFGDAQYPDILAYNIITPFYLIYLISAVRDKNNAHWLIAAGCLIAILATHHLTGILIFGLSFLSLLFYALYSYWQGEQQSYRNALRSLLGMAIIGVLFSIFARLFFGNLLSALFSSLFQADPLIKSSVANIIDYQYINMLLSPFLEFIGLAGLAIILIYFINNRNNTFTNILLVTWIVSFWLLSRSHFSVLPQRIFREISLPLAISGGLFINYLIAAGKTTWHKIIIAALFSYLIVINISQLNAGPFLLPDGFRYQSWYSQADEEKFQFIRDKIVPGTILANYSNPILEYKLRKADFTIIPFPSSSLPEIKDTYAQNVYVYRAAKSVKATYLYIGILPPSINPDTYIYQFPDYQKATTYMNNYSYDQEDLVKQFKDGSKFIRIE